VPLVPPDTPQEQLEQLEQLEQQELQEPRVPLEQVRPALDRPVLKGAQAIHRLIDTIANNE
jgi:hypothetical protein